MYKTRFLLILLTITAFSLVAGCGEQKQATTQKEPPKTTVEDVKKEARELMETGKSYTMEQKQAYEQQLAQKLDGYEQKIASLKQQMAAVKAEAQDDLKEKLEMLQKKTEEMQKKAEDLKKSSDQAWNDMKTGLDKAGEELDRAFSDAMQNFRKPSSTY